MYFSIHICLIFGLHLRPIWYTVYNFSVGFCPSVSVRRPNSEDPKTERNLSRTVTVCQTTVIWQFKCCASTAG